MQVAVHESEHAGVDFPGFGEVLVGNVVHVADPAVLGFDVDEIDAASQGVAVRLDEKGLGAHEGRYVSEGFPKEQ